LKVLFKKKRIAKSSLEIFRNLLNIILNNNSTIIIVIFFQYQYKNNLMSYKNQKTTMNLVSNFIKTFVSKLTQSPEYYDIKYYSKIKGRNRHRNDIW
jgi:hypothetical protein